MFCMLAVGLKMSGISEKFDSTMTREDEEFVSCRICFINFDEKDRVPKFLEKCYHFFCLPCIKDLSGLVGKKKIMCPVCRSISTFSMKKCDELVTNHVALRLLKVVEASQAAANEKDKKQRWCTQCNFTVLDACLQQKHETCNYTDVYNRHSQQLKSKISQTNVTCDEALKDCRKIQSVHQVVLAWMRWLQLEITHRDASNTIMMAQLESLKSSEVFNFSEEEDKSKTINHMDELTVNFTDRCSDAKALHLDVLNILNTYSSAQQDSEYIAQFSSDTSPPDLVNWFRRLNCSKLEATSGQSAKPYVKILAFLITLLSGELPQSGNSSLLNSSSSGNHNAAEHFESNLTTDSCLKKDRSSYEVADKNFVNDEPRPSCSGTQQRFKRSADNENPDDSSVSKKWRPPTTLEAAMEKRVTHGTNESMNRSSNGQKMCYFQFRINDQPSERVIFEVDDELAPVMASKFRDFCTGSIPPGYRGSIASPQLLLLDGLPASRAIPSLRGGQIIDHENLLFVADVSPLPAKLGSIFFTVKEENVWGTLVSPDFQILLAEPNWNNRTTNTIFGHVVVGLNVLERINKIQQHPNHNKFVTIIDCGVI